MTVKSLSGPALDEPYKEKDNGHDEQNVDEASHRVIRHEAKQPQYNENDGKCVKHVS